MAKAAKEIAQPYNVDAFMLQPIVDNVGGKRIMIGEAYRRCRQIDILFAEGLFSEDEYKALHHYRHHADIADRSPIRDSLAKGLPGGKGDGPTIETLNAIRVTSDCERAAGSLADILRAIVVYDHTIPEWAMSKYGSNYICRRHGRGTKCRYEPKPETLEIAQLEMKMVAGWVQAELDS